MLDYTFLYIISIPIYIIALSIGIYKQANIKNIIFYSFFYFYIVSLFAITIFPIPIQWINEISSYRTLSNNFIPFASIKDILFNNNLDYIIKIKQIIWNIILFIPMWFFIPIILKTKNNIKNIVLIALLSSFFIEALQYFIWVIIGFNYRVSDIDDIILNVLGFVLGFFFFKLFKKKLK